MESNRITLEVKMKNKPLISIIVPVFNAEEYLALCLDSILNQTYRDLEILCINDGSCDGSIGILKQYKNRDSRIVIIDKQNEGVSTTRNVGLKEANGDYLMFVDADDWIEPYTCEKALVTLNDNNADIVIWSYVSEYGESNSSKTIFPDNCVFERQEILNRLHRRLIGIVGEELEHPELADSICPVWGKLYRRDLIVKSGATFIDLSEIGTYEDGMFNLEVFFFANKVIYMNECLYHYRRSNTSSVTSTYRKELFELWQNLYGRMDQYIKERNLPKIYKEALQNRIALGVLGLTLNVSGSKKSFLQKRKELRTILKTEKYQQALKMLDISKMPKKWKLFYSCAQYRNASALLFAGRGYATLLKFLANKRNYTMTNVLWL